MFQLDSHREVLEYKLLSCSAPKWEMAFSSPAIAGHPDYLLLGTVTPVLGDEESRTPKATFNRKAADVGDSLVHQRKYQVVRFTCPGFSEKGQTEKKPACRPWPPGQRPVGSAHRPPRPLLPWLSSPFCPQVLDGPPLVFSHPDRNRHRCKWWPMMTFSRKAFPDTRDSYN